MRPSVLLQRFFMTVLGMQVWVSWLCLGWLVAAQASETRRTEAGDYPIVEYTAQVGMDAWQFAGAKPEHLLMMATNTQWHYKTVSPWGVLNGRLMLSPRTTLSLKARSNQAMGSHVDELSADWAVSPKFGLKAGVVDYKTSWCRTYDIDSPWVRENDPFCTVVSTSGPSGGAPGVQAYVNIPVGIYRMQGIAGMYNPLLMNYNTREFSNINYPFYSVEKNKKQGASLSILNLETATEFRLGVLGAQQSARVNQAWDAEPFRMAQTYGIVFAGLSFYVTPKLNLRLQTLRHVTENKHVSDPGATLPHIWRGVNLKRTSNAMELSYQMSAQDIFALAVNNYDFSTSWIETNAPFPGYTYRPDYAQYHQRAMSLAWRRDWAQGVFTALQITRSRFAQQDSYLEIDRAASTNGLGLRIGYQF
jgi:hypothetical protein